MDKPKSPVSTNVETTAPNQPSGAGTVKVETKPPREFWFRTDKDNGITTYFDTIVYKTPRKFHVPSVHVIEASGTEIKVKNKRGEWFTVKVDADDHAWLSRFSWHIVKSKKTFYAYTTFHFLGKKRSVSMHRLITGMAASQIDHKNCDGLDNRKSNLRYCEPWQNGVNHVRKNKLGYRGVFKPKGGPTYAFQILKQGKRHTQYGFKTAEDAARAYDKMSKELHGEFGIRNFKD